MDITFNTIKYALQQEDIEGLIALGAPTDEYDHEAKLIANALTMLPNDRHTAEYIISAIVLVWEKYFDRSAEEIALRMPAFTRIADKLLA